MTASIKLFEPDDTKYLKWINEYPEGFILTASKSLYLAQPSSKFYFQVFLSTTALISL